MAYPSVTYTFANGTANLIDATEVNQNFTDIINGLSDSTKDLDINALTVNGLLEASGDVYNDSWQSFATTTTGFASLTYELVYYKKIGKLVFVNFRIEGTSNTTAMTFTLPYTVSNDTNFQRYIPCKVQDNSAKQTDAGEVLINPNSATVNCYKTLKEEAWTNSGTKSITGQFHYQTT